MHSLIFILPDLGNTSLFVLSGVSWCAVRTIEWDGLRDNSTNVLEHLLRRTPTIVVVCSDIVRMSALEATVDDTRALCARLGISLIAIW